MVLLIVDVFFSFTIPRTSMLQTQQVYKIPLLLAVIAVAVGIGFFVNLQVTQPLVVVTAVLIFIVLFLHGDYILFGLLFSMLLSPEIVVGETARRDFTVRFEDFIILVMAFAWVSKIAILKDPGIFQHAPINRRVHLYIAACVLSTTFGMSIGDVDVAAGMAFVIKYIEFYIVYIVVLNNIKDRHSLQYYVYTMCLVCCIICLVGVGQYIQGLGVEAPFEGGGSIERNTLGGYLIFLFGLTMGLLFYEKRRGLRIFLFCLAVLIIVTLVISLSRSSWIAFGVICIYFLAVVRQYRKHLFVFMITLAIIIPLTAPEMTKERVYQTFKPTETREKVVTVFDFRLDPSMSARIISFQRALDEFYKHPLLGWGITGFYFIDSQYFRSIAEIGALGLLAFLAMLFGIGKAARMVRARLSGFEHGVVLGFSGGFVGLLVHSLAANTFIIVRIMEPFWFLTAIVMYLYIQEFHPQEKATEKK